MKLLDNNSVRNYITMLTLVLGALIGGTWITVQITTEHLLYQNATRAAQNWAQYLANNVSDLEQIASGETPSTASLAFFKSASKSGEVYRYTVFNRYGYTILISDREKITLVDLSDHSANAALSIKENRTIVDAKEGRLPGEPAYFAQAYVPVLVEGAPVATVSAYVDQTTEHDSFYRTSLLAAVSLCLLTGLSFSVPAVAWYRRTREKQQSDRRIRYLAHHDALTGLINRPRLIERLDNIFNMLPSLGTQVAVHFFDIDHFKEINDTLGHDGGDFLLKTIGQRLNSIVRTDDLVARIGGDEFVVVQSHVTDRKQAEDFANRVAAALSVPMSFQEQEIAVTVTIGVAMAPADGATSQRALKSADLALYAGKAGGRARVCFFEPEMDEALQKRVRLETLIRDALRQNKFELNYQPVYEIAGNKEKRLIGYEALARLSDLDGTPVPPATFIPVVEEMRMIDKLGAWVLREACRTAKTWPPNLTVAVNLSPSQFESGTIVDVVDAALKETGLDPKRLELEITETLLLRNDERTLDDLNQLKELGATIVMDDFGTGYSSLAYLWRFPFDKIKIDRSFMENFEGSSRDVETVVKTIIALGRELRMRVTVEGVETKDQVDFLYNADADQVQGFYFGRPIPAAEIGVHTPAEHQQPPATKDAEPLVAPVAATC